MEMLIYRLLSVAHGLLDILFCESMLSIRVWDARGG
jgi:hypothetical protein